MHTDGGYEFNHATFWPTAFINLERITSLSLEISNWGTVKMEDSSPLVNSFTPLINLTYLQLYWRR